jgi:Ni,Fe-hydrogenase III component G
MADEEKIKQGLEDRFSDLKDAVVVKRERRLFADVPIERFEKVFDYLVKEAGFSRLPAITGMDETTTFGVIYHLVKEEGTLFSLRTHIDRQNPVIKTVTSYFPAADIYERELVDLLGIQVKGLASGPHYPLPDNWPPDGGYPLRKDWKGLPGSANKGGAPHE